MFISTNVRLSEPVCNVCFTVPIIAAIPTAIADNSVPPGGINTYYWTVPEEMGPTDSDPQCLTRIYTSGVNPIKDMYSGLIGPLLVCKRGTLTGRNEQVRITGWSGYIHCFQTPYPLTLQPTQSLTHLLTH